MQPVRQPQPTFCQQMTQAFCCAPLTGAFSAGMGYLGAAAFTAISPPVAAVAMGTWAVTNAITTPIFDKIIPFKKQPCLQGTLNFTAAVISGALMAKFVTAAVTGTTLTAGQLAASLAAAIVISIPVSLAVCCAAACVVVCVGGSAYFICPDKFEEFASRAQAQAASVSA